MPDVDDHLHGWGYEGRTVDDLINFVREVGATVVMDVRLTPLSRRPGFSKRRLTESLDAAGIAYLHLPALGNPRDNRPGFAAPASREGIAAHARFRDEVLSTELAQAALDTAARLTQSEHLVVLCFEADQDTCHRQLVIDALRARNALVPA